MTKFYQLQIWCPITQEELLREVFDCAECAKDYAIDFLEREIEYAESQHESIDPVQVCICEMYFGDAGMLVYNIGEEGWFKDCMLKEFDDASIEYNINNLQI